MARLFGLAWIPLISAVVWFGTLLALLIVWLAEGHPRYTPTEPKFVYVSDVGGHIKPLFIAGACVTAVFYVATLIINHMLRYGSHQRLPEFMRRRESVFSIIAIIFGILGAIFLVLLTIFDTFNHSHAHYTFTGLFIVFVLISTIFNGIQLVWLHHDYPDFGRLRTSAILKAVLIAFGIVFAILFAGLGAGCTVVGDSTLPQNHKCDIQHSVAAGFEWGVAFIFVFYVASYMIELNHPYFQLAQNPAPVQQPAVPMAAVPKPGDATAAPTATGPAAV